MIGSWSDAIRLTGWCFVFAGLLLAVATLATTVVLVAMDLPDSSLDVTPRDLTVHRPLRDASGNPVPVSGRMTTFPLTSTWWGLGATLTGAVLVLLGRWRN